MSRLNPWTLVWRTWRRSPTTTGLAIVALGLGIGATATTFAIVHGVLASRLPFPEPDRLVAVGTHAFGEELDAFNGPGVPARDLLDWREATTRFEGLAAYTWDVANVADEGPAERVATSRVSWDLFRVLRVAPALGRGFEPADDRPGAAPVVVVGHDLWQRRFAGDPGIVGRSIRLDGEPTEVVGVMPPGFTFPTNHQLWLPVRLDPAVQERQAGGEVWVIGRLGDGVDGEEAAAELATMAARLAELHPETHGGRTASVADYRASLNSAADRAIIPMMFAAVSLVLAIACANVAGLLLARAAARAREMALRSALGAGRGRVIARLLLESLTLSLPGAALGLLVAKAGTAALIAAYRWKDLPYWISFEVTPPVALFVAGAGLVTGLLAALVPAIRASGATGFELLKDGTRGSSSLRLGRLGRGLVVAELALAAALVTTTGLMARSVLNYQRLDPGFATSSILTASLSLPEAGYADEAAVVAFFERLAADLRELPEVEAAAVMSRPPGTFMGSSAYVLETAEPAAATGPAMAPPEAPRGVVGPGFFELYRIRPLAGRVFDPHDDADAPPVVVVNASFAATSWPGEDALGKRLRLGSEADAPWRTVVGVVPDAGVALLNPGLAGTTTAGFYVPHAQEGRRAMSVAVATRGAAGAFVPTLRDRVRGLDPGLAIDDPRTMERVVWEESFPTKVIASTLGVFGAVALLLAAVGVFAITSFSVEQRTPELGVRMALGARPGDVLRLVLRQTALRLAVALAAGLALAWGLASGLRMVLYGVEPADPLAALGASALLAAVALLATLGPALRAARIDPLSALRQP